MQSFLHKRHFLADKRQGGKSLWDQISEKCDRATADHGV